MAAVVGLWGGSGGIEWDDGSYTGINKISLTHGDAIGFLQVTYDSNGHPITGNEHANNNKFAFKNETIEFAQGEYIVKVNGYIGVSQLAQRAPIVRSLTFKTNKKTYGPYGVEAGQPFDFPIEKGLIVGFKGASGDLLDAIGFHLSPHC